MSSDKSIGGSKESSSGFHFPLFYLPFSIGIIVALLMSSCAMTGCYDKGLTPFVEAVNGLLVDVEELKESAKTHEEVLQKQAYDVSELRNDTDVKFDLFQNEIVKIKNDIKNKFPQASDVITTEQTSISSTPFLTLTMNKSEFLLGETITFRGMATPTHAVIITIKLPDRALESVAVSKTDIINGEWIAEYPTRFDSPKGTYQVYARQLDDQTKTLTFIIE